jgi:hypothetical protein
MNQLFDPEDPGGAQQIVPVGNGLLHTPLDYDDELETIEPGYRYVIKRPSGPSAGSSDP